MRIESMASAAVRYASRGWQVFPVQSATPGNAESGKMPLFPKKCPKGCKGECGGVGHGCLDATSDPGIVAAWWERYPAANIGLRTGRGTGLWVLDVDVKPPKGGGPDDITGIEGLEVLEVAFGALPETKRSRTGSGGSHYFWRVPPGRDVRPRSSLRLPDGRKCGIDVRGEDSYVVVPPSPHHAGRSYTWLDEREAEFAPDWLLDLVAPVEAPRAPYVPVPLSADGPQRRYVAKVLESACADIGSTAEGRHDALNKAAFLLGGYIASGLIDRGDVERELTSAALASMGDGRADEIQRTVTQGIEAGAEKPLAPPERPPRPDQPAPPAWMDDAPPIDDDDSPTNLHHLPTPGTGGSRDPETDGSLALAPEPDDFRPAICISQRQASDVLFDAWQAVLAANRRETDLFVKGGRLVEVRRSEDGARIEECGNASVELRLVHAARWTKLKKGGNDANAVAGMVEVDAEYPPEKLSSLMLARAAGSLPVLERVIYAPTFGRDFRLIGTPGYHAGSRTWYEEMQALDPAPLTLDEAVVVLRDWLCDFPFASDTDFAHTLALFLLPFVRDLVGLTPVHLIEASREGTGKTLLARVLMTVALGRDPTVQAMPQREEEIHKTISAALFAGLPVVLLDNLKGKVDSPSLEAATTSPRYAARVLGASQLAEVSVRCAWIFTANNATLSPDMVRRSVRIRLVREQEDWDASMARHPDIVGWTAEHRSLLVSAALKLIASWIQAGSPAGPRTLGSYETWARVVGGILVHAGIGGFLEKRDEYRLDVDPTLAQWRAFVAAWAELGSPSEKRASGQLVKDIVDPKGLFEDDLMGSEGNGRLAKFGRMLTQRKDQVFGGWVIACQNSGSMKLWYLRAAKGRAS